MRHRVSSGIVIATSLAVCIGASGCRINVDLTTTPVSVSPGDEVNFKVKVTNQFNCPLRGVVAVVIPFVPQGALLSQIPDPEDREHVQSFLDDFCAAGEFEIALNGGEAFCSMDGGDVVCRIQPPPGFEIPTGAQESLDLGAGQQSSQLVCESDGVGISCRIPQSVLATAAETLEQQGNEQLPLVCLPVGPLVVCTALTLNVGEMQMDDFDLIANQTGIFHNYVVAFSTTSGGVCRTGVITAGTGCNEDADCGGVTPDCSPGICSGSSVSSLNGLGCDPNNIAAECTDGTCTECEVTDGELLSGVACETTLVGAAAPASSSAGLLALTLGLFLTAVLALRRSRYTS